MFIAIKTDDGRIKGKISFYCKALKVSRQAFNNYLKTKDAPWKYQLLADAMLDICNEDECNDTYGRIRMYQALKLKQPDGVPIPSERTVYRVMEEIGLNHKPKRKPNGITKADKEGILIKFHFYSSFIIRSTTETIVPFQTLPGIYYLLHSSLF